MLCLTRLAIAYILFKDLGDAVNINSSQFFEVSDYQEQEGVWACLAPHHLHVQCQRLSHCLQWTTLPPPFELLTPFCAHISHHHPPLWLPQPPHMPQGSWHALLQQLVPWG
jgi:hypothetical protein